MDGILVIDKPAGMTSHDVVSKVRRILKTKRVGHTGTLDPFATGVLVLVVGSATRLARFIDKDEKEYTAVAKLGFATDSGDLTGSAVGDSASPSAAAAMSAKTDWNAILGRFRGNITQTPPMYSAKKVHGQKLYELARKGVEIERKAVEVTIRELDLISAAGDELSFRAVCSAGTYIRTLAQDIAAAAGVAAHLTELRRLRAGRFSLGDARGLDALAGMPDAAEALLPVETAVGHLPLFELWPERVGPTRNGMSTRVTESSFANGEAVRMAASDGELIAVGYYNAEQNLIQPKVVLV